MGTDFFVFVHLHLSGDSAMHPIAPRPDGPGCVAPHWLPPCAASSRLARPAARGTLGRIQLLFLGLLKRAQPQSGAFPPAHPRLHKRWFAQVLEQAAALLCASSRGRTNPRMVKRRNSPYASHDRALPLNRSQIFHPELLPPLALTRRKWVYAGERALI